MGNIDMAGPRYEMRQFPHEVELTVSRGYEWDAHQEATRLGVPSDCRPVISGPPAGFGPRALLWRWVEWRPVVVEPESD